VNKQKGKIITQKSQYLAMYPKFIDIETASPQPLLEIAAIFIIQNLKVISGILLIKYMYVNLL
jgi:hypothetical protein